MVGASGKSKEGSFLECIKEKISDRAEKEEERLIERWWRCVDRDGGGGGAWVEEDWPIQAWWWWWVWFGLMRLNTESDCGLTGLHFTRILISEHSPINFT